jgi:hypothetical protein
MILRQQEQLEERQEEIRRLGSPGQAAHQAEPEGQGSPRRGGRQRAKTAQLQTVDEGMAPQGLPADAREQGWRFKGYADDGVQDRVIEARNLRYRLEAGQGPQGQWLRGKLPTSVNGHDGPEVVS